MKYDTITLNRENLFLFYFFFVFVRIIRRENVYYNTLSHYNRVSVVNWVIQYYKSRCVEKFDYISSVDHEGIEIMKSYLFSSFNLEWWTLVKRKGLSVKNKSIQCNYRKEEESRKKNLFERLFCRDLRLSRK